MSAGANVPVVFVDAYWHDDLRAASPQAREIAEEARLELERHGIDRARLLRCGEHDGAALGGLLKIYLPLGQPIGPWGLVLAPRRTERGLGLVVVAFGVRHPPSGSSRWSVYRRAHFRLTRIRAR